MKTKTKVSKNTTKNKRRFGVKKPLRQSEVNSGPNILDMVEEALHDLKSVSNVKATIRDFEKLRYPEPKTYKAADIIKLREEKLNLSQAAFAAVCNTKVSTLQKWESGVNNPTPPLNRLFQIIEKGGLKVLLK